MKTRKWLIVGRTVILVALAMLALAGGLTQAQEPEPPEGEVGAEGEVGPAVTTFSYVPIQGRLTDAAGNALNGDYSIVATIYDAASGGTALCSNTGTTSVANGLFMLKMLCWNQSINGQQLYLGIKVGDDPEMTPRQEIYPVPYAVTVYPGAIIKGDTSYVFVPGTAFVKNTSDDSTRWATSGGAAIIRRGTTAGDKHIRIPITIPAVLYGQPVRVTSVRVYYRCQDGTNNYITETELYKMTDADSFVSLVNDSTNRQSNTAASYTLATDSAQNTLSENQGILTLRLRLNFADDNDYVQIGGVRLTLETTY
jgi:hypothetical protein